MKIHFWFFTLCINFAILVTYSNNLHENEDDYFDENIEKGDIIDYNNLLEDDVDDDGDDDDKDSDEDTDDEEFDEIATSDVSDKVLKNDPWLFKKRRRRRGSVRNNGRRYRPSFPSRCRTIKVPITRRRCLWGRCWTFIVGYTRKTVCKG